ncbi:hypothetical protein LY78DRAFT_448567 [Colletotrichum sublineola]|nr:hypothetical protein LY78DRAFT_448567 [Colletotrichum sublineola]
MLVCTHASFFACALALALAAVVGVIVGKPMPVVIADGGGGGSTGGGYGTCRSAPRLEAVQTAYKKECALKLSKKMAAIISENTAMLLFRLTNPGHSVVVYKIPVQNVPKGEEERPRRLQLGSTPTIARSYCENLHIPGAGFLGAECYALPSSFGVSLVSVGSTTVQSLTLVSLSSLFPVRSPLDRETSHSESPASFSHQLRSRTASSIA